ncbi:MAG: alginate export family protein [Planctomycetota bacterium]
MRTSDLAPALCLALTLTPWPGSAASAQDGADPLSPRPGAESKSPEPPAPAPKQPLQAAEQPEARPRGAGATPPASKAPAAKPPAAKLAEEEPWTLDRALGLPDWLHVEGANQTRYEYLFDDFRAGSRAHDTRAISLRTTLLAELRLDWFKVGGELEDSRAYALDDTSPINTTIVNPVELIQAYIRLDLDRFLPQGNELFVRGGRFTRDLGSRRLMARPRFRNSLNGFTGLEAQWKGAGGWSLYATYALPIERRPTGRHDLRHNEPDFDREDERVRFWALFAASPELGGDLAVLAEAYLFGLKEQDTPRHLQTRNRELYTPGFRVYRRGKKGALDFELESALQLGRDRASASASDRRRLDHFAFFVHAQAGYTLDAPWSPRLILLYDVASGDDDPSDGHDGRFDSLFGIRRPDFGPTGLYGALTRGNLNSPGGRLVLKPVKGVTVMGLYRAYFLYSRKDAWSDAGLRDVQGESGRFVGNHIEGLVRWDVLPGNLRLEAGAAALVKGHYARTVPGETHGGEPIEVYVQAELKW